MDGLGNAGQRHVRNLRSILGIDLEILAYREQGLVRVITPTLTIEPCVVVEDVYNINTFSDLDKALAAQQEADSLRSVRMLNETPYKMWRISEGSIQRLLILD